MRFFECCLRCIKRHVGCHSTCEEYIEQKAMHDKCMDTERVRKDRESAMYDLKARLRKYKT